MVNTLQVHKQDEDVSSFEAEIRDFGSFAVLSVKVGDITVEYFLRSVPLAKILRQVIATAPVRKIEMSDDPCL